MRKIKSKSAMAKAALREKKKFRQQIGHKLK
jgi:hypothetical protein